jgi:phage tail-like protein
VVGRRGRRGPRRGQAPGASPLPLPPEDPPGIARPDDLAFDADDVLLVSRNGAVVLIDRRDRWPPARAAAPGFAARRLAPLPGGGAMALDREAGRLARLRGRPLRRSGADPLPRAEAFRPVEPNSDPPRLMPLPDARLPDDRQGADIAVSEGGRVAVTAWVAGADAELHLLVNGRLVFRFALEGLRRPVSLAWLGEDAVAVIAFDGAAPAAQAFVYEVDAAAAGGLARPLGAVHRLLEPWRGGFCKALGPRPRYLSGDPAAAAPARLLALRPLSQARHARRGTVRPAPLDSGLDGCVWHRATLDADVPEGTAARLWALASDDPSPPPAPGAEGAPDWAPHRLGGAFADDLPPDAPVAVALSSASDPDFRDPAFPGALPHTVLLQQAGRRVRRLAGRFLHLHLELLGDARATPRLAALRVTGARFAWRDRYLPALFGEALSGPDGAAAGPATPPDFLDRLLGLFESRFTEIEDRIAAAWLLTDPGAAPDDALPWLAEWVGIAPEPAEPAHRLRQRLRAAPHTARLHASVGGVLAALELATGGVVITGAALDPYGEPPRPGGLALASRGAESVRALVLGLSDAAGGGETAFATGGAVTGGEIVLVEGFRLRRTFATLIGVDMRDLANPLIPGGVASGNSIVGDTLFLGAPWAARLLAAMSEPTPRGARATEAFLDALAHRALILVRDGPETADLDRLRAVAEAAAPAHVELQVLRASAPLLVAVASLVGVDTYLVDPPPTRTARLNRTDLGRGDVVAGTGGLDRRGDGPAPTPPVAVLDGPIEVSLGSDFVLSAGRSTAFGGAAIARNIFLWD